MPEADLGLGKLLKNIRTEENISLNDLSLGLMSVSQLSKVESGERTIDKNVRDRLLERLGIAKEIYENLLDICDYEEWDYKRKILSAIREKDTKGAACFLAEYETKLDEDDKINYQFILVMRGEVLKQEDAAREDLADCYQKALLLTIPEPEKIWNEKRPLSALEINLLLEALFYGNETEHLHKYRVLMDYIDNGHYDEITKVKIYPKIVYYYLKKQLSYLKSWTVETQTENLNICKKAVDMLRDAARAYYLVELLEIETEILGEEGASEKELLSTMVELYDEYSVPAYMQDCTYLYQQNSVYAMYEVLRNRRAMLGLTQEQLCEGICSVKSLRRAEKGQTDMQMESVRKILNRLGLSGQMQWARLITNDRDVIKDAEKLIYYMNNRDYVMAYEKLEKLKLKVSFDIPQNKQFFMEKQAVLDLEQKKIDLREFLKMEKEAMRCTLPVDNLLNQTNVYLTEREVTCIRNSWSGMEEQEKRESIRFLLEFYEKYIEDKGVSEVISMYEFVTEGVVEELGNMGEHEFAQKIDRKAIRASLSCRRLCDIHYKLYDIWWNENERRKKEGKETSKDEKCKVFKKCIILSHYVKRYFHEKIYREKLEKLIN